MLSLEVINTQPMGLGINRSYFQVDRGWTFLRGGLYLPQEAPGGTRPQMHLAVTSIMHPYVVFPPSLTIPYTLLLLPEKNTCTPVSVLGEPELRQAAIGCPTLASHPSCVSSSILPCTLAAIKHITKADCLLPFLSFLCLFFTG